MALGFRRLDDGESVFGECLDGLSVDGGFGEGLEFVEGGFVDVEESWTGAGVRGETC